MRYSRQELVIGKENQKKVEKANVAIIGMGALGTVAADLLVRSGVSSLILIDFDIVEESNLQRQSLFTEKDIGKKKVTAAKAFLEEINSKVHIETYARALTTDSVNILTADLILDCTDNIHTRLLLNDYALKYNKPLIIAAAAGTEGFIYVIEKEKPCYNCIFGAKRPGETCENAGVLNMVTHVVASIQASEALKIIIGKQPATELVSVDINKQKYDKFTVKKNDQCASCKQQYTHLENNEPIIDTCSQTNIIRIIPQKNLPIDIKHIKNIYEIKKEYDDAVEIRVDKHNVLVHTNGIIEIKNCKDIDTAKAIQKTLFLQK